MLLQWLLACQLLHCVIILLHHLCSLIHSVHFSVTVTIAMNDFHLTAQSKQNLHLIGMNFQRLGL